MAEATSSLKLCRREELGFKNRCPTNAVSLYLILLSGKGAGPQKVHFTMEDGQKRGYVHTLLLVTKDGESG